MVKGARFFILVTAATTLLDQSSKYLIALTKPQLDLTVLELTFMTNTGAGFGLLAGQNAFLTLISAIAIIWIVFSYSKIPQEIFPQTCWALCLGGIVGNFMDRLLRGYVIDFLNFRFWPAFNVADAAITIGAIGLAIYFWKSKNSS